MNSKQFLFCVYYQLFHFKLSHHANILSFFFKKKVSKVESFIFQMLHFSKVQLGKKIKTKQHTTVSGFWVFALLKVKTSFKVSTAPAPSLELHLLLPAKSDCEERRGKQNKIQKTVESITPGMKTNPDMDKSRPHLSYAHTGIKHRHKCFSFELKPTFHLSFEASIGLHCIQHL